MPWLNNWACAWTTNSRKTEKTANRDIMITCPRIAFSSYDNSGSARVSLRIVNPSPKAPYPKNGSKQKSRSQNCGHRQTKIRFQQVRSYSPNEYKHKHQS